MPRTSLYSVPPPSSSLPTRPKTIPALLREDANIPDRQWIPLAESPKHEFKRLTKQKESRPPLPHINHARIRLPLQMGNTAWPPLPTLELQSPPSSIFARTEEHRHVHWARIAHTTGITENLQLFHNSARWASHLATPFFPSARAQYLASPLISTKLAPRPPVPAWTDSRVNRLSPPHASAHFSFAARPVSTYPSAHPHAITSDVNPPAPF